MNILKFAAILLLLAACRKGATPKKDIEPQIIGDTVAFNAKVYPTTMTQDPNDNYLFGDSVYVPRDGLLTKISLNIINTGGYTTKCHLIVNRIDINTIGRPKYRGIGEDSTFTFYDTVALQKGWNFIKFTGYTHAPAKIYYSIYEGDVSIVDDSLMHMRIVGLPLQRIRKF